jgi:hypothetical protein
MRKMRWMTTGMAKVAAPRARSGWRKSIMPNSDSRSARHVYDE